MDDRPVTCPSGFGSETEAAFDELVAEHWDTRLHQQPDRFLFAIAASCLVTVRECARVIAADGLSVPATRRGAVKTHPCVGVQDQAARQFVRVLDDLGCTPRGRKRLGVKAGVGALRSQREMLAGVGASPTLKVVPR